jgi:hypothetical protein
VLTTAADRSVLLHTPSGTGAPAHSQSGGFLSTLSPVNVISCAVPVVSATKSSVGVSHVAQSTPSHAQQIPRLGLNPGGSAFPHHESTVVSENAAAQFSVASTNVGLSLGQTPSATALGKGAVGRILSSPLSSFASSPSSSVPSASVVSNLPHCVVLLLLLLFFKKIIYTKFFNSMFTL